VVGVALVPAGDSFAVLRALRVLRVLRLVAVVPSMRRVVEAFIFALPGLGWVIALLALILFVFSVMATVLFGASHPDLFGSLGASAFTLFTVMTLEGWPDLARSVMQTHPWAWIFFISFILSSSFTILNLFIGIIVDAMQSTQKEEAGDMLIELRTLREEVRALHAQLSSSVAPPPGATDLRAGPE
jgi:voltage-gated sodium channel